MTRRQKLLLPAVILFCALLGLLLRSITDRQNLLQQIKPGERSHLINALTNKNYYLWAFQLDAETGAETGEFVGLRFRDSMWDFLDIADQVTLRRCAFRLSRAPEKAEPLTALFRVYCDDGTMFDLGVSTSFLIINHEYAYRVEPEITGAFTVLYQELDFDRILQ